MKTLSWNCRGLGNPATIRALGKILQCEIPNIVFLMETKVSTVEMRKINEKLGYKGCFTVDCEGLPRSRRGGLCMLWSDELNLSLISYSKNHIICRVSGDGNKGDWYISGIYGWPENHARIRTWDLMSSIRRQEVDPWLCMGDFNEIMWSFEKKGGLQRPWSCMEMFRNAVKYCALSDLGFSGNQFTWSNSRKGENNIRERLDRFLANDAWKDLYPSFRVKHLPRYKSDHSPVIVNCDANSDIAGRKRSGFRFENMWLNHPKFLQVLQASWRGTCGGSNLNFQLGQCGADLLQWANKEFGSIKRKKKELNEQLSKLQSFEENERNRLLLQKTEKEMDHILKLEETMWYQRSRALWLKDGDKNSSFFHQKASHRKKRNEIKNITDEQGKEMTKYEDIVGVIREYFVNIFTSEAGGDMTNVLDAVERKVTSEMNDILAKPFTAEEVIQALKQMHPDKAPGPDGMTPFFFQKFWSVVKNDVLNSVLDILNNKSDPSYMNHTHVVLIPKIKTPVSPKDFRPISLCNVVFRIITKTVANRLKLVLPNVISASQSAFLPGRLITDNAMTAFEIFHSMKIRKKGKRGWMAMKLDMSKAYDRVEWGFLEAVMTKLGFNGEWIQLVMRCVRTVSYSVLVNGSPSMPFNPGRGLRQGDPLSPYLFLICAEAFTALLRQAEVLKHIHGVKVVRDAPAISHLFFADDTILFARATNEEADAIKRIIKQYEQASGQRISLEKTEITVSANVSLEKRRELSSRLGVRDVEAHTKYLGLPTLIGRAKRQVFAGILERAVKKMTDWKEKSLSQAGREVLIKSVIQSIPAYAMNCFLFPISLCQDIEKASARFFWGSSIENRKHHWAKWDILTSPKAKGGIGFKELHFFNIAMLAKQLWGLSQHQDSLSFKILKSKYFKRCDILDAPVGFRPSYLWRSLMAAREIVLDGAAWRIGDGRSVLQVRDRWIGVKDMRRPAITLHENLGDERVSSLIDHQLGRWREEIIRSKFIPQDAYNILSIPLAANPPCDRRIWRYTRTGHFSVKSAYHAAIEKYSKLNLNMAGPSVVPKGWKRIWAMKSIPRVRLFVWRICSNSLPTRDNLYRRGSINDPMCGLCGEEVETIDHLMMRCQKVIPVWYVSMVRLDITALGHNNFKELLWSYIDSHPPECVSLMAYLAWEIWKHRNCALFENRVFDFSEVARKAQERWGEFQSTQANSPMKASVTVGRRWERPPAGKTKANCDIAVKPNGRIGLGFVIRNHIGDVILAAKTEIMAEGTTTVLEGLAIRYALRMARQYHLTIDIVESDNMSIVDNINGSAKPECYADIIVDEIRALKSEVGWSEIRHTHRSGNEAAHAIAHGHDFICINHIPEHVARILLDDVMV